MYLHKTAIIPTFNMLVDNGQACCECLQLSHSSSTRPVADSATFAKQTRSTRRKMLLHLDATRVKSLKKGLSCPQCHTIMREPVTLSCGDSLCRSCLKKLPRQLINTRKPVVTCPQCGKDVDARAEVSPVNEALWQTIQTLYHQCEPPEPVPTPSAGKCAKRRGQKRTRMIEDISTCGESRGCHQRDGGYPLRSRLIATVEREEQSQSEETETEEEEDAKPVGVCCAW